MRADTRKSLCYSDIRNNQCLKPSSAPVTKSSCCCTVDTTEPVRVGWGQPCQPCPAVDTDEFRLMCPYGPGMTSTGAGTVRALTSIYWLVGLLHPFLILKSALVMYKNCCSRCHTDYYVKAYISIWEVCYVGRWRGYLYMNKRATFRGNSTPTTEL